MLVLQLGPCRKTGNFFTRILSVAMGFAALNPYDELPESIFKLELYRHHW